MGERKKQYWKNRGYHDPHRDDDGAGERSRKYGKRGREGERGIGKRKKKYWKNSGYHDDGEQRGIQLLLCLKEGKEATPWK